MGFLSFLGLGNSSVKNALKNGAVIIDVRTANEFDQGKVPGSINIPLDRIEANAIRIKGMNKPVIFCCASGARSSNAIKIMQAKGLKEVYNGGSWLTVLKVVKSL